MKEKILELALSAIAVLTLLGVPDGAVRRGAIWYGTSLIRLVTLGQFSSEDLGPIPRFVVGIIGFVGAIVAVIYALVSLAMA